MRNHNTTGQQDGIISVLPNTPRQFQAEIKWELEEHLVVLSTNEKGWTTEVNRIRWNGNPAKYDLRSWNSDHTRMSKGITLDDQEFQTLINHFK